MDAVIFVAKSFIVTVAIVMVLQLKIGGTTIENSIDRNVRNTGVIDLAQEFADSTSRVIRNSWTGFVGGVNKTFNLERRASSGSGALSFDRSREYLSEKAETARTKVKKEIEEIRSRHESSSSAEDSEQ